MKYILPVKLDDTDVPGARPTTGYLDGRSLIRPEIANMIGSKAGVLDDRLTLLSIFKHRLPRYRAKQEAQTLFSRMRPKVIR